MKIIKSICIGIILISKMSYCSGSDTTMIIKQFFMPNLTKVVYIFGKDSLEIRNSFGNDSLKNVYKLKFDEEQKKFLNFEIVRIMHLDSLYYETVLDGYAYEITILYNDKEIKKVIIRNKQVNEVDAILNKINIKILKNTEPYLQLKMTYD